MNVTALLDVPTQRSAGPLDAAVGNDASDPAFANVMSRYQGNDNDSLAQNASEAPVASNSGASADAAATTNATTTAATDAAVTDPTGVAPTTETDTSGATLPLPTIVDGQILPPSGEASAGSVLPGDLYPTKSDDALDTADPNAAAMIAFVAPVPPSNLGAPVVVAAPPADSVVDSGAARRPVDVLPGATPQITDAASAPDEDSAPVPAPIDPLRLIKKDGDAAALTKPTVTTGMPTDDAAAQRAGSVVHALRAFGLGHGQTSNGNGSANPGGDHSRAPAGDPLRDSTPKIPNAHLAAALEAAAQKDPTLLQQDGPDGSIRTDAISLRPNGSAEGVRDVAATRLGDLAQQHAPRFAAELADRVLVLRSQRFDSATVSLEPRDLGRIDIQVRVQADTTHVAFTTQHAAVRDALEGQMPRLRAMLEEAGLSLGAMDVSHSGHRGAGDPGTGRAYTQPQTAAATDADAVDSSSRWQRRVETSLIDLHA